MIDIFNCIPEVLSAPMCVAHIEASYNLSTATGPYIVFVVGMLATCSS